jgi:alpha-N-acetylglucosamine transferase
MKIVVIVLTWKRQSGLKLALKRLSQQHGPSFKTHISNGDLDSCKAIDQISNYFIESKGMDIEVTHDGNNYSCFRRFMIAREYAEMGYDIVLFLDDDITIPRNYVDEFVKAFEPETYHSNYAWTFQDSGQDYYKKRTRIFHNDEPIKYLGAGVSMLDPKIFLDDRLFDVLDNRYDIDDLWMSYFADHVLGWKLKFVHIPDVIIGGGDSAALYSRLRRDPERNKAAFLRKLVGLGWNI